MKEDDLPVPCPQCDAMIEDRGDAMIHMLKHAGEEGSA